tara:strand:+ start:151 stop:396 length:246 start_codon:yes stop_codon:yes gene_type:complete
MRALETINNTDWIKITIEDKVFYSVTMTDRELRLNGKASKEVIEDIERILKLRMVYDEESKWFNLEYKLDNDVRVIITLTL